MELDLNTDLLSGMFWSSVCNADCELHSWFLHLVVVGQVVGKLVGPGADCVHADTIHPTGKWNIVLRVLAMGYIQLLAGK